MSYSSESTRHDKGKSGEGRANENEEQRSRRDTQLTGRPDTRTHTDIKRRGEHLSVLPIRAACLLHDRTCMGKERKHRK